MTSTSHSTHVSKPTRKHHERGFLKRQARNPLGMQNREGIRERNRRIGRSLNRRAVGGLPWPYGGPAIFDAGLYPPAGLADHGAALPRPTKRLLILQPGRCKPVVSPKRQRLRSRGSRRLLSRKLFANVNSLFANESDGDKTTSAPSAFRSSCARSAWIGPRADFRPKVPLHHAFL